MLNKLRYMRGSEPFPGYDALSVAEILVAIEEADLETINNLPLRHPLVKGREVGDLLEVLLGSARPLRTAARPGRPSHPLGTNDGCGQPAR